MKNIKEVIKAVKKLNSEINIKQTLDGINISPNDDEKVIYNVTLDNIFILTKYFKLNMYVDFEVGCIRLH